MSMCKIQYSLVEMERQDGQFYISLNMHFICRKIDTNQSHLFAPVLSDGNRQLELPLVLLAGKGRYWAFKRALWGLNRNILRSYRIMKLLKAADESVIDYSYNLSLHYEDWMDKAKITVVCQ